ncbi:mitochondrial carrier domain-containing protein, partial [Irpex lacteus]
MGSSLLGIAVTNGTVESIIAGLIAGSATTVASNPFWVIQTTQTTHRKLAASTPPSASLTGSASSPSGSGAGQIPYDVTTSPNLKTGGLKAFWRGLGPALVLVVNPVLQYTVFEQLKNVLVRRRTAALRAASRRSSVVAVLSDVDYFFLGALAKLGAVLKSRMQSGSSEGARYKLLGLYKGIGTKLTQSVLNAAILFVSQRRLYEITKQVSHHYGFDG